MITRVSAAEVLVGCREPLGLPDKQDCLVDDILLATLLRRSAGIHCPCSRTTLRDSLLEGLRYLSPDEQSLSERIGGIIEGLIVGGDLLELNDVAIDDSGCKGDVGVRCPSRFCRSAKRQPLPSRHRSRPGRFPAAGANIANQLRKSDTCNRADTG